MLSEREVVTVAFGNYSSLVAAQWANGTSHYDAHHSTLYTECRTTDVLGGNGGGGGGAAQQQQQQRTRVPRLLLLDAPYASSFDDVEAWERKYNSDVQGNEEEERREREEQEQQRGRAGDARGYVQPSSVLWGGGGSQSGPSAATPADRATQRLAGVAQAVRQHVWAQHGLDGEDGSDEDNGSEEDDDEEEGESDEDDYTRLRRELGIAPYKAARRGEGSAATGDERSGNATYGGGDSNEDEEDEEGSSARHNNIPRHKLSKKQQLKKLKHRLFDSHSSAIPWWQYITTGLAARSVTSVKPLQHVDATGDIPALHSFGYGLANLHADRRDELQDFSDALLSQLESADQLQGVQCFTDGDGMFGGAAANLLEQFWEDAGAKTPVVHTCTFAALPSFITDRTANASGVAFRERRIEEAALNQLLATVTLSRHPSAVYIPIPMAQWDVLFRGTCTAASRTQSPSWLQDDRATAQYLAAVLDTALYGVRDGNNTNIKMSSAAQSAGGRGSASRIGNDDSELRTQGPMYYMDDWCRVVRPAPSMRVAAAMGSLPLPVSQSSELWHFLESCPLLPDAPVVDERTGRTTSRDEQEEQRGGDPAALRRGFVPLTHAMDTHSPLRSAGQVLGHAVTFRGVGVLPSSVYPAREAMLRYAMPLGTSTYLPLVTESNYPISGTFPMELMFVDPAAAERQLPRGLASLRDALQSVDVGAHVLSTYASAPMLKGVVTAAQAALRYKMDRYCTAYEMEADEWRETVDEGLAMYDDYHHAEPSSGDGSDNDDY